MKTNKTILCVCAAFCALLTACADLSTGGSGKTANQAVEHVVQVVNKSKTSTAFLLIGDGGQRVAVSPGKESATRVPDGTRVRLYSGETILLEESVKEPATFTVGS